MEYSRDYLVHYYEIGKKRRLTPSRLMHYFEDIATLNSEAQGFTLDYFDRTGQGFMLLKWDITVHSWPFFNETVRIITRPSAFRKFLANREYAVVGNDGVILSKAQSVWIFADARTRRPARVPDEMYAGFGVARGSEATFEMLEDVPATTTGSCTLDIKACRSDIDNNNHVNNVRYVEWALESLPDDFVNNHTVQRIKVHYKKELQCGDGAVLVSEIVRQEFKLMTTHSIYNGDREVCHLHLNWIGE